MIVNNQPNFDNIGTWKSDAAPWFPPGNLIDHYSTISSGYAVNYMNTGGDYVWWKDMSNVEFIQGSKPWGVYSPLQPSPMSLKAQHNLFIDGKMLQNHTDVQTGMLNAYVNLWCLFNEPVGSLNSRWVEIYIRLFEHVGYTLLPLSMVKGVMYPVPRVFQPYTYPEPGDKWYYIGYRPHVQYGFNSFNEIYINVSHMIAQLGFTETDLSKGRVVGVSTGVEGTHTIGEVKTNYLVYECVIPGDANGDGHVGIGDLAILGASWGKCKGQIGYDSRADVNMVN